MKKLWTNERILNLTSKTEHDWITTKDDCILDIGFKKNQPSPVDFDNNIDLEAATLMPSFIDQHIHFSTNV